MKAGTNYYLPGEHLPNLDYSHKFCAFQQVSDCRLSSSHASWQQVPFPLVGFAAKYDIHAVVVLHPEASHVSSVIFVLENICSL